MPMKINNWRHRLPGILLGVLLTCQVGVVIGSWLITALFPGLPLRSLLSNEGIRWFYGHFPDNIANPFTVWMLMITVAYGSLKTSGIFRLQRPLDYRRRLAVRVVGFELGVFLLVLVLLTLLPHAVLLSVDGHILHRSFMVGFVPYVAFSLMVVGVSFGVLSGKATSMSAVLDMLCSGFRAAAPFFVIYVVALQLVYSVLFVAMPAKF